jgi:CHASE3 domain sensor protein
VRRDLDALTPVQKDVLDLEAGVRGFVITRDPRFLQPRREGQARLPADLAVLHRRMRGRSADAAPGRVARADEHGLPRSYAERVVAPARARRPEAASQATTAAGERAVDGVHDPRRAADRGLDAAGAALTAGE